LGVVTTITKEYGLTHDDLARILPRLTDADLVVANGCYSFSFGQDKSLVITPGNAQFRRIASIKIPLLNLRFEFAGMGEREVSDFFVVFDRAFQKGGG
jgi:hypothetical protein